MILFTLFTIFISTLLFLSATNKSLGLRKRLVQILLKIFEKGRIKIDRSKKLRQLELEKESEENEDDDQVLSDDSTASSSADSSKSDPKFGFDVFTDLLTAGIQAIVQDQVTQRFEAEEIQSWNLLTRTNQGYQFLSKKLTALWILGFYVRYFIFFPLRVTLMIIGTVTLTISTGLVGLIPDSYPTIKRYLNDFACKVSFRIMSRVFSAIITYHNEEYQPKSNGICVANHTSPIDVVILSCNSTFSLIGQKQGGFLGILERALGRAGSHIWFERSEMKDRAIVTRKLKAHAQDKSKPPILIFPEGTCINNSAVMQFKKGSFEVDTVIYPVAIKYDPLFGNAFWDSSRYSYLQYLFNMMTSWAIVVDVWYLPPMYRNEKEGETAIQFANRVKAEIARQGGLVDLEWDGQLKRTGVKKEWKQQQQLEYSKKLNNVLPMTTTKTL